MTLEEEFKALKEDFEKFIEYDRKRDELDKQIIDVFGKALRKLEEQRFKILIVPDTETERRNG